MSSRDEAGSPNRRCETSSAGCSDLRNGEEVTENIKELGLNGLDSDGMDG